MLNEIEHKQQSLVDLYLYAAGLYMSVKGLWLLSHPALSSGILHALTLDCSDGVCFVP